MTSYDEGVRIERLVRDDLTAHGFDVIRASGSKGPADLVAIGDLIVLLVNVKRVRPPSPAERQALERLADRLGRHADGAPIGWPLVALKPPRQPITYRLLTGTGPRDWIDWEPYNARETAAVPHGHVAGGHVRTGNGWQPVETVRPDSAEGRL